MVNRVEKGQLDRKMVNPVEKGQPDQSSRKIVNRVEKSHPGQPKVSRVSPIRQGLVELAGSAGSSVFPHEIDEKCAQLRTLGADLFTGY